MKITCILLTCFLSSQIPICLSLKMSSMVGGISSDLHPADAFIQELIEKVRSAAENKAGVKFDKYEAVSYKTQLVAGTNYFVKVDVGDGKYVHLRVFQPLPQGNVTPQPELAAIQLFKTKDDPIEYF
ncbi:cystatin-B-like [Xenia sp. Carnegie-2017]|uniref:cystatin-B-like n=1 Tax=Xenia sp. Carnegie-2017 TaxID=2897299 RepID=UPI001F040E62|nr:cystatin-B-like [Xenia sp. Carnegie-2017]